MRIETASESRRFFEEAPHKKDLHLHLEGVFKPDHIVELWDKLNIPKDQQPEDEMRRIMSDPQISLFSFINKLSTRWLSYTVRTATLLHDRALRNPSSAEDEKYKKLTPEYIYKTIFKEALSLLHQQGLHGIELQVALLNLTREGDMSSRPILHDAIRQEQLLFHKWEQEYARWEADGVLDQFTVDMPKYIQYFTEVVDMDRRFCSGRNKGRRKNDSQMDVRLKFQLRREKQTDKAILMNVRHQNPDGSVDFRLSSVGLRFMNALNEQYQAGNLDGLEIAGVEDDLTVPLYNFTGYLQYAQSHAIPITVHAGEGKTRADMIVDLQKKERKDLMTILDGYYENKVANGLLSKDDKERVMNDFITSPVESLITMIASAKEQQIYDNLAIAINYGALRIGHAVRLFDPEMTAYLEEAIERGIYLELNDTSNVFTGVKGAGHHPIIRALGGDHPLFTENPDKAKARRLLSKLRRLVVVATDDPVIINDVHALVSEQAGVYSALRDQVFTAPEAASRFNRNASEAQIHVLQANPLNNARAPYSPL